MMTLNTTRSATHHVTAFVVDEDIDPTGNPIEVQSIGVFNLADARRVKKSWETGLGPAYDVRITKA